MGASYAMKSGLENWNWATVCVRNVRWVHIRERDSIGNRIDASAHVPSCISKEGE